MGYSKNSRAYLVYNPHTEKVSKQRLVKFIKKGRVEQQTQTDNYDSEIQGCESRKPTDENSIDVSQSENKTDNQMQNENEESANADASQNDETAENVQNENEMSSDTKPRYTETSRYPRREKVAPKYLEYYQTDFIDNDDNHATIDYCYRTLCGVPQTYSEALKSPEAPGWKCAMREEIDSLKQNDTFELTTLPEGRKTVGGKWVYALKENAERGQIFKARYVAKGYNQTEGIDYHETFAPTASITSVRARMQIAVQNNLIVHQMDVKTAYLHAPIDEEIFLEQPEGFENMSETGEKLVCRLKKSLYGLKQSGRNWYKLLNDHLEQDDFLRNLSDHCVYRKQIENDTIIVIIWVDYLIIAASNNDVLDTFKETMKSKFNMKDLGKISYFLGIHFEQYGDEIKMNQKKYILKMLERFGKSECKPRSTPCEQKVESIPVTDENDQSELANPKEYREIVGSLIYAMTCTRRDISWIVSKLS